MHILIVKMSSLGDVIQTTPVIQDLLRNNPEAKIDWVVEENFASLLGGLQGVQRVIPIAQRRWRRSWLSVVTRAEYQQFKAVLREQAYDVVIDVQGLIKSAWVARLARLSDTGLRYSFGNQSEACSYEWPVRFMVDRALPMPWRIHAIDRYRLLCSLAMNYDYAQYAPQVLWEWNAGVSECMTAAQSGVWLVHGTTRADNEWPEHQWIAIAKRLIAQGERVVLPQAGNLEQARVARIAAHLSEHSEAVCVLPEMPLDQLAQCMSLARGVIGVDTGLSHLAVALNLPHLQIFSQARAFRAGPQGGAHQVSIGGVNPGDAQPDLNQVWQAWQQIMQYPSTAPLN